MRVPVKVLRLEQTYYNAALKRSIANTKRAKRARENTFCDFFHQKKNINRRVNR